MSLGPLATGENYTIASKREPDENAWRMILNKYLCMLQMQSSNIIGETPSPITNVGSFLLVPVVTSSPSTIKHHPGRGPVGRVGRVGCAGV